MSRQKIIIIVLILTLILGGIIIWQFGQREAAPSGEELLREVPGLPEEQWTRVIMTREISADYRVAVNKVDGYEVTVPSNWQILETASVSGGFKAYYNTISGGENSAELTEGVMLTVTTFDDIEKTKTLFPASARFEDVETSAGRAHRTSYKATEDRLARGESVEFPIENSLVIKYIFPSDKKVYLASCLALGDNFNELASLCEKQILTFKIIK